MDKVDIFNQATTSLTPHKYYHGSDREIHGEYLRPREAFNSVQDGVVSGAFVTSDINHAKYFAIHHCIGKGMGKKHGNVLYLEQLQENIKSYFYIYTAYETEENPFIHDKETEYYSTQPIKIAESEKCDTAEEIRKLGYEVYVLDEPLKTKVDKGLGHNFNVQKEFNDAIENKRYHRVDIASMIEQQSKNRASTMFHKLFHQKND